MSENRGIFSLEEFYDLQVSGAITDIFDPFRYVEQIVTLNPYGYMRAGTNNGIERIDFNNDTAAISPQYTTTGTSNKFESNFGNLNYGYITGGQGDSPSSYSTNWGSTSIRRLDYSNDTGTMESKGPFAIPRYNHAGVGNNDYGYSVAGRDFGYPGPNIYYSDIFRTDYSNDTVAPPVKSNYPFQNGNDFGLSGTGNMNYGWIAGGKNGRSTVCRIDYASDTTAPTLRSQLNRYGENGRKATGNSSFGYWQASYLTTRFIRLDFSNDTATSVDKGTSHAAYSNGAVTSKDYSYLYGYFYPYSSVLERMDYSNDDIAASPKGPMASNGGGGHHCAGVSAQQFGLPTAPVQATRTETGTSPIGTDYGYWAAGNTNIDPYRYSLVERIDFNNDTATASPRGNLAAIRYNGGGTGNTSFGYHGAGRNSGVGPSAISAMDRVDYANDSAVAAPKGPVTLGRWMVAAFGNASYGYWGGGRSPSPVSTVDRADFSNDTPTTSTKGPLTIAGAVSSGGTGNQNYGYVGGGDTPTRSTIQKIDYSNDTAEATNVATTGINGNPNRGMAATGNKDYGYWGGGDYHPNEVTYMRRLDYSNDTTNATPKGNLTAARYKFSATGNSSYGYWGGGAYDTAPGFTTIDRLDYANDTATTVTKGPLATGRWGSTSTSSRESGLPTSGPGPVTVDKGADGFEVPVPPTETFGPAYGYIPNGWPVNTRIQRIDFDNDTATTVNKGNLASPAGYSAGMSNTTHGYVTSGLNASSAPQTTVQRIDYASDTSTAATKGPINYATRNAAGNMGNTTHGYIASGGGGTSRVDRITYASDTSTATSRAVLATNIPGGWSVSGISDASYGYVVGGGYGGSTYIQRIDFSNDNASPSPKSNLTTARAEHGTNGNTSYAWITGGPQPGNSSVERIDYANDTSSPSPRGNTTAARYNFGGTGNPNYGYFAGGGPGARTDVDRIDYGNDTATAVLKGPLNQFTSAYDGLSSRNRGQSISSPNPPSYTPRIRWVDSASEGTPITQGPAHGYFAGGAYPSVSDNKSTVDRIDYDNDTVTASPKGNLASATKRNDAVMNSTHGYVTGDMGPAPSRVHRIDYANDTATASIKGPLSANTSYMMDVTNINFGYVIGGGGPSGQKSKIDRIDFSNDTATASNIASLPTNRWSGTGIGNKNFGYICGGKTPSIISNIDRLDYSSDTTAVAPKGPLSATRRYNTATSNNDFGYVAGTGSNSNTSLDRVDFSNDTATASPKGPLATAASYRTGTGSASFGYFAGGQNPSSTVKSNIDRIDYSNDTATALSKGPLSIAKNKAAGISSRESGLPIPQPTIAAAVQRPFPVPTQSPDPRGPAYGYFSGGFNPGNSPAHPSAVYYSNVDRVDFASDTSTASPKGKLDQARANAGAAGSPSYGYIGASDLTSGYSSIVARVDYANDSATAVVKGSMSPGTDRYQSATSNTSYGWFAGGQPSGTNSKVQRIDFSNDDTTASPRGNLSLARQALAGAGNADYGWHAGGYGWPAPDYIRSVVDRIDYSNDSVTTTPKGYLSVKRRGLSGTGNASYGYYSGGYNVVPGGNNWVTNIDRIDYSNDTPTATPKGNLSQTRSRGSATGNTSYGYAVGGEGNNDNGLSTVDRIDFANDTSTAATKGPLTYTARGYSGFSARANALPQ